MDNKYSKVSGEIYKILKKYINKEDTVLEFGSSIGHLSCRLASDGYKNLSLLDIRKEPIDIAEKAFIVFGVEANCYHENFFDHKKKYDVVWNSGCIQCCTDPEKYDWIRHANELSNKLILFYPDKAEDQRDNGKCEIKGFDQCKEYSTSIVYDIVSDYYDKVMWGVITKKMAGKPFPFNWIVGVEE
jgi:hypothetical protein